MYPCPQGPFLTKNLVFEQFQDILKPAYNSVDMVEVELVDQDRGPREFDEALIAVITFQL